MDLRMIVAPCAANEQERLAALRRYGILDTAAEADFDAITSLLAAICETPVALVSLVDRDRQWFKSRVGLDAQETHRDLAFCAHAILQEDVLIVPDATQDNRFADNPLVQAEPRIRFYAGAPLITPDHLAIGTLCAIDMRPRELTPRQLQAIRTLADHVVHLLELRLKLHETQQLNLALETSRQQLEAMTAERNQLFANINHEMRTPLSAVIGFTRRLQSRILRDNVPAYIEDGLGMIATAAKNLGELVDDVLDLSKIDAGKMEVKPVRFVPAELLKDVVNTVVIKAEERNVQIRTTVSPDVPDLVVADARKITQILLNLLSNAVKFTPSGKQIHASCEFESGQLNFVIQDEGVGIPESDMAKIFMPFVQTSAPSQSDMKGTGLGLAIVKAFVDLMEGKITVSSLQDVGTTFTVVLPVSLP